MSGRGAADGSPSDKPAERQELREHFILFSSFLGGSALTALVLISSFEPAFSKSALFLSGKMFFYLLLYLLSQTCALSFLASFGVVLTLFYSPSESDKEEIVLHTVVRCITVGFITFLVAVPFLFIPVAWPISVVIGLFEVIVYGIFAKNWPKASTYSRIA